MELMTRAIFAGGIASICAVLCTPTPGFAGQPLETETARLPGKGHGNVQMAFEYLTASSVRQIAIPVVLEYGLANRLELTVEPVAFSSTMVKGTKALKGIGDTEVILTYLLSDETASSPALAIAGEVKIPTARKGDLGTGKPDFRLFGIASKRAGKFDLHANAGFTLVGNPAGTKLGNVIDYAVAAEYQAGKRTRLVAELLGETVIGSQTVGGLVVEGGGTVFSGGLGIVHDPNDRLRLSFGVTYNSESEAIFKPGITFRF
jgi:hypothetical protein